MNDAGIPCPPSADPARSGTCGKLGITLTWESATGTLHAGAAEAIKTVTGKAKLTPG